MDKAYNISDISFDKEFMIVRVDNILLKIRINEASVKLAKANDAERHDFKISPSGYGIHWNGLDEDLSINGLMKIAKY